MVKRIIVFSVLHNQGKIRYPSRVLRSYIIILTPCSFIASICFLSNVLMQFFFFWNGNEKKISISIFENLFALNDIGKTFQMANKIEKKVKYLSSEFHFITLLSRILLHHFVTEKYNLRYSHCNYLCKVFFRVRTFKLKIS